MPDMKLNLSYLITGVGSIAARRTKWMALMLLIILVACRGAGDPSAGAGELTVDSVTADLTLPTETGAIYMRVVNHTGQDDALVGAAVPGCETTEAHEMVMQGDVMTMGQVGGNRVAIPAGQTVVLERGGLHVMCLGKTGEFSVGQSVPIMLEFENAGSIPVTAEVVPPGE
jgi:copper(I)-binding protein